MGRGRAKAKQTKVARDLKYRPVTMDVESLQRELSGSSYDTHHDEVDDDQYADLAEAYKDFDDEDEDPR